MVIFFIIPFFTIIIIISTNIVIIDTLFCHTVSYNYKLCIIITTIHYHHHDHTHSLSPQPWWKIHLSLKIFQVNLPQALHNLLTHSWLPGGRPPCHLHHHCNHYHHCNNLMIIEMIFIKVKTMMEIITPIRKGGSLILRFRCSHVLASSVILLQNHLKTKYLTAVSKKGSCD